MANHQSGIARSNYRQLRVTFTQETNGRLSCSLYAKGINAAWNEHTCIDRWTVDWEDPIMTSDDAVQALVQALCERRLPGI